MGATDKDRDDGSYASAMAAVASNLTRRVRSDGSGLMLVNGTASYPYATARPANIGGAPIELPIESEGVELLVRPSVSVPDDPVQSTVGDILTHNVSVHLRVTPRYRFAA
jgi:hypothetical protein